LNIAEYISIGDFGTELEIILDKSFPIWLVPLTKRIPTMQQTPTDKMTRFFQLKKGFCLVNRYPIKIRSERHTEIRIMVGSSI